MKLDVENLGARHPILQPEHTSDLALHAAVALQRQRHVPGIKLLVEAAGNPLDDVKVHWRPRPADAEQTLDAKRLIELGAETIALLLVREAMGWVVRRRLQEGEFADWLLVDEKGEHVALEIGGTGKGDAAARMRAKVKQVAKFVDAETRSACVVRFREPAVWLQVTREAMP